MVGLSPRRVVARMLGPVLCASPDSLAAHGTPHDPCWPAGRSCWRRGGGQICRWRCIRSPGIWRLMCAWSWIGRRAFRGAVQAI